MIPARIVPALLAALLLGTVAHGQQRGDAGVGRQTQPRPGDRDDGPSRPVAPPPSPSTVAVPRPVAADVAAGADVVETGGAGAPPAHACHACHGRDGVGDGSGAFPRIDGQPAWYLYKQLRDYASGSRPNDVMSPIASGLSDIEMRRVAAYYAARPVAVVRTGPAPDLATLQAGAALASAGAPADGVRACSACHSPAGGGDGPSHPRLAGQYATYQMDQLRLWRDDVRRNDPLNVMRIIAGSLSDEQIRAVSLHYEHAAAPVAGR